MVRQLKREYFFVLAIVFASSCQAASFVPDGDVIGKTIHYEVTRKDTLYDIARHHDIGIVELLAANPGVDPWIPEPGTNLTLPTAHILPEIRQGIVINLAELRLFYYRKDGTVLSFPVGIGREGWRTPVGKTRILRKREAPVWTPPPSIRAENSDLPVVFPPGPDNPLGDYALDLGMRGILIHGTNRPYGIGKRSSHGCIRLYPEDIAVLFQQVGIGDEVTIVDRNFKLGWEKDELLLEVTPTQRQADRIAEYQAPEPLDVPEIYEAVQFMAGDEAEIDWYQVETAILLHDGIPVIVGKKQP